MGTVRTSRVGAGIVVGVSAGACLAVGMALAPIQVKDGVSTTAPRSAALASTMPVPTGQGGPGVPCREAPSATDTPATAEGADPSAPQWHPGAWRSDWPGPLRSEPLVPFAVSWTGRVEDASELNPATHPFVDISAIRRSQWVAFDLAALPGRLEDPSCRWVAYGLVYDLDLDGVADYRLGMDNLAGDGHREWVTDLRTGSTQVHMGPPYGLSWDPPLAPDTYYPGEDGAGDGSIHMGPISPGNRGYGFYAFAGVIEPGGLVTDFAPDAGWIRPEREDP